MQSIDDYLRDHAAQFEDDLCALLRIPSVSADSRHKGDVERASAWVDEQFEQLGFEHEIVKTAGHPIVFAQRQESPKLPTVLVYGHYDVQPPDPLDEWITPPFDPTRRDGNIYARGATDDKGQMLTHVFSTRAWMKAEGRLPVNLKFIIEGEEEVGSESLGPFLEERKDQLACDIVVISDTSQFAPGVPAVTYGLRGISYHEVRLTGPKQDLHSGVFGGAVRNPAVVLAQMLAALIDERGRIQVPGFYDDVQELTAQERQQFAALPFDEERFRKQIGVTGLAGEEGFSTLERRWARPTYDVNGIWGGYQGEGEKTVLPAKAGAKFSFRLVPHQDPQKINAALDKMLADLCPPEISLTVKHSHAAPAAIVPLDSPYMKAASRAIAHGFGREPVFIREGGSIPIVSQFSQTLGVDTLLLGWGLDDDNTHSPNEKFNLADFHRGIKSSAWLWHELGQLEPAAS